MTTIEAIVRAAKMGREVRFIPCSDDMVRVEIERCESKWHFTHELVKYANVCEHIAGDSINRILDAVDK